MFYLVKDGVKSDLTSGSGLEKTAASLALKSVLAELSTIPRSNSVLLDEITARVSEENLENIHKLINKILNNYDYILMVSHNPTIKEWCSSYIEVEKTDNISRIKLEKK